MKTREKQVNAALVCPGKQQTMEKRTERPFFVAVVIVRGNQGVFCAVLFLCMFRLHKHRQPACVFLVRPA
ncbi:MULTISPECIES: hypothetical protein, partial [Brevibacillus]|uniref:hypothetical protein n=1 Tax=Brevibacillus TaxID=55080 RepID=UPI002580261D